MNKKVSIIVPVYNVEKYLRRCLDSLVNQTLKDIEIIVVNDGSPDNSQDIIDEYASKYSIIKSFIKENGGVGRARNYGIQKANGEYIGFVDSDDYVKEDMFELLYKKAIEENADYVTCDLMFTYENKNKANEISLGIRDVNSDIKKAGLLSPLYSCTKLIKKDFLLNSGLMFSEGLWYEDLPVTIPLFVLANKVAYVTKPLYYYVQRDGSVMNSKYNVKMNDIFVEMDKVCKTFKDKGLFEEYYSELEYLYIEHFLVYGAFRFLRTDHYEELMTKAFDYVKKEFPNYRRNKYIKTFNLKNRLFLLTNNKMTMHFWHWYLTK